MDKKDYWQCVDELDRILDVEINFDIVKRTLTIQKKELSFYFIDGYVKDDIIERLMQFLMGTAIKMDQLKTIEQFSAQLIPYVEVEVNEEIEMMVQAILSGTIVLLVEGFSAGIFIDARTYPTRGMQEPEDDRVLRGSRDGFVETLVFNTALIRRRIRDPRLRMEYTSVGTRSKTDIVLCYMDGIVKPEILSSIKKQLADIQVEALTMAQESLAEALVIGKWYSPFPKVRYTERPDTASSNVLEGKIIVIIDNSPSVMILPTYFFDFVQEAQDYYLPPLTGTYLRIIRIGVFIVTLLASPIWYYFNTNPSLTPAFLQFTLIGNAHNIPIIVQLLMLEFGIDALKLASLNTPSSLSSSFSIIGALILGDFAVEAGWFAPEVILYMAFVALANFTQPSYELGYGIKFMRVMLLILIALLPKWGLWIGLVIMGWILYRSKTISKESYLYPLIPFCWRDFKMIFRRRKLKSHASLKSIHK
ncbi:spore germination protein [Beduini massiliensis]|uniref:spore germination protein n=1 Tax=Beduini massiliensis TaxID=1585974 RepID=UPI00059A9997|nr:spore germination protein [Beduini massiliensis]